MLFEFAGFRFDYNRLRRLLGTTDLGTPYSRVQLLSRINSDLPLIYREGETKDLCHFIDQGYPIGIFVATTELPYWKEIAAHAVVVVGYSNQDFYLNDPTLRNAPQVISWGNLHLAWEPLDQFLVVVQRK
jgi:hypothetical protein